MTYWARITLGLLALLAVLSCSKSRDKIPVADVEDRQITLAQFEESYQNVDPRYLPQKGGFEGHKEFLTTMINKEVMAIKADQLGYDKDPYVVSSLEMYRKMGLPAALLKFRVADKVKVTEDEIREYYNREGITLTLKQILVDTKEEAEEVYQLLQDGNDFETTCKRYSKAPDASVGGKVLTATFGGFAPEFQDELFSLPTGSICRPSETMYGYFVIKILKKEKKADIRPFEEERERFERIAYAYKEKMLTNELSEAMREKAGWQWYNEGIEAVFEALPPDRSLTNPPARSSEKYPLLSFSEEDLKKPVLSYNDKTITVADFSDIYDKTSFFERPRREHRWGGIKRLLVQRGMNELLKLELETSKIEDEPEVANALRSKREELMVSKMYEDLIVNAVQLDEASMIRYYKDNIENFKVPEKRRFGVVLTGDRAGCLEAYQKILDGENFKSVVLTYSIDTETRQNDGTSLLLKGEQPELDEVGFSLAKVGDVSEPFQTTKGWMILKLIETQRPKTLKFEQALPSIKRALKSMQTDALLKEKLEEWKSSMNIQIFDDNLKKADLEDRIGTATPLFGQS